MVYRSMVKGNAIEKTLPEEHFCKLLFIWRCHYAVTIEVEFNTCLYLGQDVKYILKYTSPVRVLLVISNFLLLI